MGRWGYFVWSAGSRSRSKTVRTLSGPRLGSKRKEASKVSARAATQKKKSQEQHSQLGGVETPVAT
eukprot:5935142-Pyramimonas_sp.AAC.1